MTAPITVAVGAATDTGRRRAINEDALLASAPVFLVADGMGGHDAGEVASRMAVAAFADLVGRDHLTVDEVREAVEAARRRIDAFSSSRETGAGTTLSGVVIVDVRGAGYWLALNIGDSRTYRLAGDRLEQISVDHSLVQELVDSGRLAEADAERDPRRNVITRALGAGSSERVDFWMLPASRGDRLLICSDGLPREVGRDQIAAILSAEDDPQTAASRLVEAAVARGGRDNVSVIVVDAVHVAWHDGDTGTRDIDADTRPREPVGGRRA
ncbi:MULTISPECIES: PP2C family protein-serine/threonine phosphatase [Microbacterium]|uniref:Serine/threonine protein phosphatase n=1 Tax=Microbacterium barkeri TaxID=33917 RepID=A0A9W6H5J7_9MICO|nr:protein phosphatase 2C domain-containing protein [Microbacterium barkeri]MDR6878001.1 protein phosphatase [Microbacterium barkeri]GLJ63047.1 serine/threonine protein phosphatase [Microbacterium barkeri]